MKKLLDINKKIDNIYDEINTFDSDERKEIKKNNKIIDSYVLELEQINKVIYKEINDRYKELIPLKGDEIDNSDIDLSLLRVRYLSDNDYIFKMGIDKNIYEIRYGNSLDKINTNIIDLINKFSFVGVVLSKEDFKYSLSLYKYMSDFFDNKDSEEFNIKIKDSFDSLYWECPELVNHIYLCFMLLLDKYKDKFEIYIKNKFSDTDGYDFELKNYYKLVSDRENNLVVDEYLNYEKFSNGELRIEDYLSDSINRKEIISKFIDYDKYINLSIDEKNYFYDQIKSVYYDLCEYLWINKYGYLITKIKEIYSNKGSYISNYSTLMKSLRVLNKQRISLNNKLFVVYNRINGKNNSRLMKKYNNLFNKVNNKINEIISSYDNYDEILFINDVINKLNDDSSYYDAFKVIEGHYNYLVNFMKDKDGSYDDYIDYLYKPYLNISNSIPFMSDVDIEDKLVSKYDLFDIDVNLDDKSKLKEDLEYVIRLGYLESSNIDLDKFKLIFDIKKIIGE